MSSNYKGLFRIEPSYLTFVIYLNKSGKKEDDYQEIAALCDEYDSFYVNTCRSVNQTSEMPIEKMWKIIHFFRQYIDNSMELVYFNEEATCPLPSLLYGIDVAGKAGGYSMLEDEDFLQRHIKNHHWGIDMLSLIKKRNEYGLFDSKPDAQAMIRLMCDYKEDFEGEEWCAYYVYKVLDNETS
jgi:hypothetical protein